MVDRTGLRPAGSRGDAAPPDTDRPSEGPVSRPLQWRPGIAPVEASELPRPLWHPTRPAEPAVVPEPAPDSAPDSTPDLAEPALDAREDLADPEPALAAAPPRGARFPTVSRPPDSRPAARPDSDPGSATSARRVRVVLAERKGMARPVRTIKEVQEGTPVGELLRSNLIGAQLAVALRFGGLAVLVLGSMPLLFAIFPVIGQTAVMGVRLPWLILGVLVYPFLFGLGWLHTIASERVEQGFAEHVQD